MYLLFLLTMYHDTLNNDEKIFKFFTLLYVLPELLCFQCVTKLMTVFDKEFIQRLTQFCHTVLQCVTMFI